MPSVDLGFEYRFVPAGGGGAGAPPLLLLHGTGGDENDLLPLGRSLAPGAALLSPRGKVLENGMPRFFRRLAEGVFDLQDLGFFECHYVRRSWFTSKQCHFPEEVTFIKGGDWSWSSIFIYLHSDSTAVNHEHGRSGLARAYDCFTLGENVANGSMRQHSRLFNGKWGKDINS